MSIEDLQAKLQATEVELAAKNADLEERGNLLFKTKTAIEQLQEALTTSQDEQNRLQDETNKLEASNAARVQELVQELDEQKLQISASSTNENELQVRLAQSEAALDESRNSNAAMQDTLAELEASHQDVLHQLTQKDVDLDECLDKITDLSKEREENEADIRDLKSKLRGLEDQLQSLEARSSRDAEHAKCDIERLNNEILRYKTMSDESLGKITELEHERNEVEKSWSKRLSKSEHDWSKKMLSAVHDWSKKLDEAEKDWGSRLEDNDARRMSEIATLEASHNDRMNDLHRLHSQEMASAEVEYRKKLQHDQQILEKLHGKELAELNSERAQQQEELKMTMEKARIDVELRMGNEKAVIEKEWGQKLKEAHAAWSATRADIEQKFHRKMEDIRNKFAIEKSEMEKMWMDQFETARLKWEQEHTDAEKAWVEKLASVEKEYEAYEQDMKEEIEGKLTDLIKRLTDIAKREAKREGRRTELIKQVDEIRETGDEEFKKRCQVEKALRQAASIFKKELHEKNEELGILNGQLRSMQDNPFSKAVPMIDGNQSFHVHGKPTRQAYIKDIATIDHGEPIAVHLERPDHEASDDSLGILHHEEPEADNVDVTHELQALRAAKEEYQRAKLDQEKLRKILAKKLYRKSKGNSNESRICSLELSSADEIISALRSCGSSRSKQKAASSSRSNKVSKSQFEKAREDLSDEEDMVARGVHQDQLQKRGYTTNYDSISDDDGLQEVNSQLDFAVDQLRSDPVGKSSGRESYTLARKSHKKPKDITSRRSTKH